MFKKIVLIIVFVGFSSALNAIEGSSSSALAQEAVFKKNPIPFPGGPKSLQIKHEYNLSTNDLKDKKLERFIGELLMVRDYVGYIREAYENENDPNHAIVKKYFVDPSKVVTKETIFKKNPIPFRGRDILQQIIHEYNLTSDDLKDQGLKIFLSQLVGQGVYGKFIIRGNYDAFFNQIYNTPRHPDYAIVKKYFVDPAKVAPDMLSTKDILREELRAKFGNDCPARLEDWEGYKDLVEKFNNRLKAKNIDVILTRDTMSHVCHPHFKQASALVGGHFDCDFCVTGCSNQAIGKGKQRQVKINTHGIEKDTTYFCPTTTVSEVLDKIATTFETKPLNIRKFKQEKNIEIQADDGEYIIIYLKPDGRTIATFYPSPKNFEK